jgi:hypothetical protein
MSVRVLWLLKLAIFFFCAKAKVVFVNEDFLIFLISELPSKALEKGIVGELECLLDYLFCDLALGHSIRLLNN